MFYTFSSNFLKRIEFCFIIVYSLNLEKVCEIVKFITFSQVIIVIPQIVSSKLKEKKYCIVLLSFFMKPKITIVYLIGVKKSNEY